jgi:putative ABC transport system permease protein
MNGLIQDVLYALRQLRKGPGFAAVAVITLALGIGANTAIFSVVNAVLLRPLPYKDDGRLVVVLHNGHNPVAPANFADWQSQNHSFESMGAAESWSPNLTSTDNPENLAGLRMTAEILPMLGVQPLLGRVFLPEEQQAGKDQEVVLSYSLWQNHFAGDANVLGRTVALNGNRYTIVGVMPKEFQFAPFWATEATIWAPLALGDRIDSRGGNSLRVFARLKPGVTLEQAQAEMAGIADRLDQQYPGTNRNVQVVSLREKVVGNIRPALLVLLGAVGFVLLIGCANVAHMFLARSAARQREIAVRAALGAMRWRVLRQYLIESLLIALMGGVCGLLLAEWGTRVLIALGPEQIPRLATVAVDQQVLLFVLAVSLITGLVFGILPAWRASAANVSDALKEGERGTSEGIRRNRLRSLLVSSEFAFAVILLAGAGLMIRTFVAVQNIDPGFDPHNVLTMMVRILGTEQATSGHTAPFYQQVLQKISAIPGVQSASAINHLPLAGDQWGFPFHVQGRPVERPGESPFATFRAVFPGYFRTMSIPVLNGRDINQGDNSSVPDVVVINDYMARRYWPGENAVGKRITFDDPQNNPSWVTVVGVVKNTVRSNWVNPAEEELFVPYLQSKNYLQNPSGPFAYLTLVVRTTGDPASLATEVQAAIHSIDRNVPISELQTMEQVVTKATGESRFYLTLLGAFAGVALVLAAVGIYGVMSYSVSRRIHEIGIRMALGAQREHVLRLVVWHGVALAIAGIAVGLAGALALTRLMSGLLYGTKPADPATFVASVLVLGLVAIVSSYIPARRAAKVEPMVALRYE